MTLYELAHHPDAFNHRFHGEFWWGDEKISTPEQFHIYLNGKTLGASYFSSTEENEFRMHLLFIHWATLEGESK